MYPYHSENNVTYSYNSAGQISVCEDGTGSEEYEYDGLGNISQTFRRIVIPTENNVYVFLTNYKYDSFGRMREIIYPDGEAVHYEYTTGGLLKRVEGTKQGYQNTYLKDVLYDEQGRKEEKLFGNGVRTRYSYDSNRQWLSTLYSELPDATVLQDINYKFDEAGNILSINQQAPAVNGNLGGVYANYYHYDKQYRLIQSDGNGGFAYTFKASYSPSGRMSIKSVMANNLVGDMTFGYDLKFFTHQPRTIYDPSEGTMECYWDANGNLSQIIECKSNKARLHEWDEENRLRFVLGEIYAGYYGYDAKGERVYKLTGTSGIEQFNAGYSYSKAVFDWCVMYPNPYIVVTPKGYTKHYYAGAERIATVLGGGGFENRKYPVVSLDSQHDKDIINKFNLNYKDYDPFNHEKRLSDPLPTATTDGNTLPELDYQCNSIVLEHLDILSKQDMLLENITKNCTENFDETEIYFFHGDHLGSASWITDANGKPTQYIHYAPYGELIDNQLLTNYDERYKFTGKERDSESGYDYFGARYYASPFSFWLSVDPLTDKYPAISPYAYCTWNPVKYVDPDGNSVVVDDDGKIINISDDDDIFIYHYSNSSNEQKNSDLERVGLMLGGNDFYEFLQQKNYPALGLFYTNLSMSAKLSFGIQYGTKININTSRKLSIMGNIASVDLFKICLSYIDGFTFDYVGKNNLYSVSQELSLEFLIGFSIGQNFTTKGYDYIDNERWYNFILNNSLNNKSDYWSHSLSINFTKAKFLGVSVDINIPLTYKK